VRYADDIAIYVASARAAERVLESITEWLAKKLKLEVNQAKCRNGPSDQGSLLGFRIDKRGEIHIAPKALERLKDKVRSYGKRIRARPATNCATDGGGT
jgi:RNA-directed DNA polymerase